MIILKTVCVTKLRKVGNALGILFPKRLFENFTVKEKDGMVILYDEIKDELIIRKGGI